MYRGSVCFQACVVYQTALGRQTDGQTSSLRKAPSGGRSVNISTPVWYREMPFGWENVKWLHLQQFCVYFRVISRKWKDSENLRGASCFGAFAKTVRSIADKLYVSATCEVDIASGLPEYPIHGHLEFTQPVTLLVVVD